MSEEATAPVVAPPPGHPRFPLVDSLRAVAALSVVVYHAASMTLAFDQPIYGRYVERLDSGVALFFAISGFLLYRPFVAHRLVGAPGTRTRDYVRRRLLRIVPAYWLALTVLAIYPGLHDVFTSRFYVYYGFLQVYDVHTIDNGLGPAWTLCVEVTFYAALPVYAALIARGLGRLRRRRAVWIELGLLGALALASLSLRLWEARHHPFGVVPQTLPGEMDWFAAGMALAVISVAGQAADRRPAALRIVARWPLAPWAAAAVGFWVVSRRIGGPHPLVLLGQTAVLYTPREDVGLHALYAVIAACVLMPAILGADGGGLIRRLLADRRLAWLGMISYGIYLWHRPLLDPVCQPRGLGACRLHGISTFGHSAFLPLAVGAGAAAIACAAASYYAVERPLLRLKDRHPPSAPPPAASVASPAPPAPPAPPAVATADR